MRLTKQDYLRILLPTRKEIWIVLGLVLAVFIAYEANLIYLRITNDTIFATPELAQSFNNQIDAAFAENFIANKASLIVFWAGVGLVAYSIIWSAYSFFAESKNEIEVSTEYVNQASKSEKLQRALTQTGALVGIIVLGLATINITVPYLVGLWTDGIIKIPSEWVYGAGQIVIGFIGLCANFYLFKVLIDWIVALE